MISVTTFPGQNESYNWYANDVLIATNSTGNFPDYSLTNPGDVVTIKLVTNSLYGCKEDSTQMDFTAAISAKAIFTKDIAKGCGPLPVTFSNTTALTKNVNFTWDFGNGETSSEVLPPQPVVFNSSPYNNDTTYYVKLTADDGCSITTWRDSVFVSANPRARFGIDSTFGCSPYFFTLTNTSLGKPDTYYWDFGDGKTSVTTSGAPIPYSYVTGVLDTFRIQLVAENKCRRDTQVVDVIVVPNPIKPQINISGSNASGCAPHTVFFNNNTTGATKYVWDFGDSQPPLITTDNETTVSHTYASPGNYDVQISITNGCSDTSVHTSTTIYQRPVAAFDLDKIMLCEKDTVAVTVTQPTADAYRWDWNDGTVSSGLSASHRYQNAGTYVVTLFADRVNNFGVVCSDLLQKVVTVSGTPDARISASNAPVNCAPFVFAASAPGITDETVKWSIIDSATGTTVSTASIPTIGYTFANAGTYTVKLSAVNSTGCRSGDSMQLKIFIKPNAAFTPFTLASCAMDTTVSFANATTYSGTDAVKYSWLVNNTLRAGTEAFSYRFTASANEALPKTFPVSLVARNSIGCSDTTVGSVVINPSPAAVFSLNNPATCVPFAASISNTSVYADSYQWLVNGAASGTGITPDVSFAKPATSFSLVLIAGNAFCPPDTANYTFTTLAKPTAGFTLNDSLGCAGNLLVIPANTSKGANAYQWSWGDNTANSNVPLPTHQYEVAGRFTILLSAFDGKCYDTANKAWR